MMPPLRDPYPRSVPSRLRSLLLHLLPMLLLAATARADTPLFDAHLHYDAADADDLSPAEVIQVLDRNHVVRAAVTSMPPGHALTLHRHAPDRIVPLAGVYRTLRDKVRWHQDPEVPKRLAQRLDAGPWRGVGELHIFAEHRRSPVFHRIVELATARGLPLLMHCDPAVIDALFEDSPGATVIWAHAGAYPYPPLLRDYLARYPRLHADLSVRNGRIAADGELDPEWERLFMEYPDRFLVGVDTYSAQRWQRFDAVVERTRAWLDQLPVEVTEAIGWRNAEGLFGGGPRGPWRGLARTSESNLRPDHYPGRFNAEDADGFGWTRKRPLAPAPTARTFSASLRSFSVLRVE
jgi:hypothetical protein